MPEMHLRQPDSNVVLVPDLQKTKKESKNLKKQDIQDKFIKIK